MAILQLMKDITRETLAIRTADKYRDRPIIITLEAGDSITFRVKGTRQKFTVSLAHCFRLAQLNQTDAIYKAKMAEYKVKRGEGTKRLRKPKRTPIPFSKIYFDALSAGLSNG